MLNKNILKIMIISLFGISILIGCKVTPPPPIQEKIVVEWQNLNISPKSTQKESIGNIDIIVSANNFERKLNLRESNRYVINENHEYREITKTPEAILHPENIQFNVTIKNNMKKILRLGLAIIQMQIDGKNMTDTNAEGFANSFILPSQSHSFIVNGPTINSLPNKQKYKIGLFINDIPTETDNFGNPTKRDNIEFYFYINQGSPIKEEKIKTIEYEIK